MLSKLVFSVCASLASICLNAQHTLINGVSVFTPEGFNATANDGGVVFVNQDATTIITVGKLENSSLSNFKSNFQKEIDGEGLDFKPIGNFEQISAIASGRAIQGRYSVISAKGYVIGLFANTKVPMGVAVLCSDLVCNAAQVKEAAVFISKEIELQLTTKSNSTTSNQNQKTYPNSKNQSQQAFPQIYKELKNHYLMYISSYNSSYGGGGSSSETKIVLCESGAFWRTASSSVNINSSGAYANSGGNNQDSGTWQVVKGNDNTPVLRLSYADGSVANMQVRFENGTLYLNGNKWFCMGAEDGQQHAVNCGD